MEKYRLIKKEYLNEINTEACIYEHIKSKARVCTLQNDDENKTFTIGFRTPPVDSTGLTHILEHSVLCGSKKYPVKDPFVELIKGSLNTFLNAMTYPDKTIYPVASCNLNDFKNLMNVYMDAVLYPNIYQHKEIFMQEGWHYDLENKDADITINGVVYNEMKGAFSSVDEVFAREINHSLFPDNCYGFESGGDPDAIADLTYEQFLDFHTKFYHPSNSYIVIYGDLDMSERLAWLDEDYLSQFNYKAIETIIVPQKPFSKPQFSKVEYSIAEDDELANKTNLSYNAVVCDALDIKTSMAFSALSYALLDTPSAPLRNALIDAGIGDDIDGGFNSGTANSFFTIAAKNTEESKLDKFIEIIENTFHDLIKNGLNKDILTASLNYFEFKSREANFGSTPKGLIYTLNMLSTWLYDDTHPFDYLNSLNYYSELKELVSTNYFEELIEKYLLCNNHKSIVVCVPSKTKALEDDKALKAKLNQFKESLTEEQLQDLILENQRLTTYQETPSTKEEIDTIPRLSLEDIIESVIPLKSEESDILGIKLHHQNYFTSNIDYINYFFDIRNLSQESVLYASLLTSLLGLLDTTKFTYERLDIEEKQNTGGISLATQTIRQKSGDFKAYIAVGCVVMKDKLAKANELLLQILNETKFEDEKRIYELICEQKSRMQMRISGSGHLVASKRAMSYQDESFAYNDLIDGIGYLDFITDLANNYEAKKKSIVTNLQKLAKSIFTRDKLMISLTADNSDLESFIPAAKEFIEALDITNPINERFEFKPNNLNEGFKTSYNVQFVSRAGNFKKYDLKYTGALAVLKNAMSVDYLWDNIRVKGGAYGAMIMANMHGDIIFASYRDPNLEKTNKVYEESIEYIKNFKVTDEEMLKNVIGAIGELDTPSHASVRGKKALSLAVSGYTNEDLALERKQIINCTNQDINKLAVYFKEVLDENNLCVIGNEIKIEENKQLFNKVRKLI